MPQLNPAPWLAILALTWLIFLASIPHNIIAHNFPDQPLGFFMDTPVLESWNWPWY